MIFIALGSQRFQFNRLLKTVDELIGQKKIKEQVFAQRGHSDYQPENFAYKNFLNMDEFNTIIKKADLVLCHGGAGVMMRAMKQGKRVVGVPRLKKYGEHVDDHQIQLLCQLEKMGMIEACYDLNQLCEAIEKAKSKEYNVYLSNTEEIINHIEGYITK